MTTIIHGVTEAVAAKRIKTRELSVTDAILEVSAHRARLIRSKSREEKQAKRFDKTNEPLQRGKKYLTGLPGIAARVMNHLTCFKGIHVVVEMYRSNLLADVIGKVSARAHRLANLGAMSADLRGAFLAMSFTRAFAQSWLIRVTASVWQRVLQYFQTPRSFSSLFVSCHRTFYKGGEVPPPG